jgi:hypothetical protein
MLGIEQSPFYRYRCGGPELLQKYQANYLILPWWKFTAAICLIQSGESQEIECLERRGIGGKCELRRSPSFEGVVLRPEKS